MSLAHDLQFAVEIARSAGRVAMRHYGLVERLTKTHATTTAEAVTEGDRATQRHIVEALRRRFPSDGIVGEENDAGDAITFDCHDPDGRNWVIDPIDGTNNFISGIGIWAVCMGLLDRGMPVLGVVYDVTRDQVYCAAKGEGAWLGDKRITAPTTPMSDSSVLMLTSNLINKDGYCPGWVNAWMGQTNWKIRIFGSAAVEAVQVGAGVAHAAITVNGKLWDCVAPAAIVFEAGGVLTDLQGKPIFPYDLRHYSGAKVPFLAAGRAAQDELLRHIAENP
ncbi:MAG: inositol monophosphatase [Burkholderiales bacterium]|nr:inositol monophosphatase [Phycisphaerae bacterium]